MNLARKLVKAKAQSRTYQQSPLRIDYSHSDLLRLNLNENLVLPKRFASSIIKENLNHLDPRTYPSELEYGEILELRKQIAKYCCCSADSVALGSGSDQAIDLLFRVRLRRTSDRVIINGPTFSMYEVLATRLGSTVAFVSTRGSRDDGQGPFSLDLRKLSDLCRKSDATKIVVIASPNNPTAIQYPLEQIESLVSLFPRITFLLDEAYVEYGDYNAAQLIDKYPNLVVARTFSKAFGLASFRIGYLVSSDIALIEKINKETQYPYPLTSLSARVATGMLRLKEVVLYYAERTKNLRQKLIQSLAGFGNRCNHKSAKKGTNSFRTIEPSYTNFVLVQSPNARKIAGTLLSKYGIAVKYLPRLGAEGEFLRITVGTDQMNQRLLQALHRIYAAN